MAEKARKIKKSIPAHLEQLPPVPDKKDGMEKSLFAKIKREGAANERRMELMNHLETEFSKKGNPLFAWDAYIFARRKRELIPEFVLEYFDKVAQRMMKAENKPAMNLRKIMGFRDLGGGPQEWEQYHSHVMREETICQVLNYLQQQPNASISKACEHAAEWLLKKCGIKRKTGTIEGWYKEHK